MIMIQHMIMWVCDNSSRNYRCLYRRLGSELTDDGPESPQNRTGRPFSPVCFRDVLIDLHTWMCGHTGRLHRSILNRGRQQLTRSSPGVYVYLRLPGPIIPAPRRGVQSALSTLGNAVDTNLS
jgi:hypothetical protein